MARLAMNNKLRALAHNQSSGLKPREIDYPFILAINGEVIK